jgi:micrococcal nuclease
MLVGSMSRLRPTLTACIVLVASATSACPHQESPLDAYVSHLDVGPPDPRFEGAVPFDDAATMALDPTTLPAGSSPCRAPLLARVTRDVDGDTIHVDGVSEPTGDLDIRFIGVNAPEIAHAAGQVAECYGDEATTFTTQLVDHLVWLTFDAECLDVYGRTLAYVSYGGAPEQMWERQLLRRGFARTLSIAPNTSYRPTFESDESIAQSEHMGLWSACP